MYIVNKFYIVNYIAYNKKKNIYIIILHIYIYIAQLYIYCTSIYIYTYCVYI